MVGTKVYECIARLDLELQSLHSNLGFSCNINYNPDPQLEHYRYACILGAPSSEPRTPIFGWGASSALAFEEALHRRAAAEAKFKDARLVTQAAAIRLKYQHLAEAEIASLYRSLQP